MIWTFIAGMLCGALALIFLILVSDRSFLDLLAGRLAVDPGVRLREPEAKKRRTLAAGSDS